MSAPDSLPLSLRRSEVNRRRGLKTTPTLSQRPSLPRLLNIVSLRTLLHRLPNHPSAPPRPFSRPSHSFSLSPSPRFNLRRTPHVGPHPPSAPTTATKHERRRIFIVTSRAASSDLLHPPRPPSAFSSPFFMRLLTISSNCAHPPPPCSHPPCLASTVLSLFGKRSRCG